MMKKEFLPLSTEEIANYQEKLLSDVQLELFRTLMKNKYANSSLTAMTSDWNQFATFCERHGLIALPTPESSVMAFIEQNQSKKKYNSIRRMVINITNINSALYSKPIFQSGKIKHKLNELSLKDANKPEETSAITLSQLNLMSNEITDQSKAKDIRDVLVVNLMYDTAMRRSELISLNKEDITYFDRLSIGTQTYDLRPVTTRLLLLWLDIINNLSGKALIRSIDRHNNISETPVNDSTIYRIFREKARSLGLDPSARYCPQSVRVGSIRERSETGMKLQELKEFGRYRTKFMPIQYTKGFHASWIYKKFTFIH
ncbi:tyrosine-type recombinase/integrase [Vibrio sp. PNB22_3_1]